MIGIFSYVALYVIAAELYPGGSHLFPNKIGFDWSNNYWCHLTSGNSLLGPKNPGQPYALTGMVILGISLAFFFLQFPHYFKTQAPWKYIIPISGVTGAFFSMFVMTDYHDLMAVMAALFGGLSIVGIFFGLKTYRLFYFIWLGVFCVFLIALNGYIYFSETAIDWLPIIQKITFAAILVWLVLLNSKFGAQKKLVSRKENFGRMIGGKG